jgi:hypothetical protein
MAKGQSQAADNQLKLSNQYASQGNDRANDIFGSLFPTLQSQYANPTGLSKTVQIADPTGLTNTNGYTPGQMNDMTTASNQSLGGAVGGAVGQGNLTAARTGNAGGYATALDSAVRDAGKQQSQNALGVKEDSAKLSAQQQQASDTLKQQEVMDNANLGSQQNIADGQLKAAQQSGALSGMEGLYGDSMQELMSSLGLAPGTLNARAAGQSGLQQLMGGVSALGQLGSGAGSAVTSMNNAGFFG